MVERRRIVLDTNVWVSRLLGATSVPGRAAAHALEHGEVVVSQACLHELIEVLSRPKFEPYLDRRQCEEFIGRLLAVARLVPVVRRLRVCRDPKDDKFLELAIAGDADLLITGDRDLLVLVSIENTRIPSPADYLRQASQCERN